MVLLTVEETRLEVHDCPGMPRFVPIAVIFGGGRVVRQDGGDRLFPDAVEVFLPLAHLEVTSCQKLTALALFFLQRLIAFGFLGEVSASESFSTTIKTLQNDVFFNLKSDFTDYFH